MTAEDSLVPSRSASSLSLSSQSTHYTDYFGENDISSLIAQYPGDDGDNDFGDVTMDTSYADTLLGTQAVEQVQVGSKRKRSGDDDADASERPRKSSNATQGSGPRVHGRNSSATVVDGVDVGASVRRTDTDSTAVSSNAGSQKTSSNGASNPLSRTKAILVDSPRSRSYPAGTPSSRGNSGSATLTTRVPSSKPTAPTGFTSSSEVTVTSDLGASLGLARPSASSMSPEDAAPPVATLVPQASDVQATDFQAPKPVVVAHPQRLVGFLSPLPWGVQWEIARYVNTGFDYSRFTISKLKELKNMGKNSLAAPEVTKYVRQERKASAAEGDVHDVPHDEDGDDASDEFADAYSREQSARLPWDELDREDEILPNHQYGGLGCNEHEAYNESDPDWYGGKVHFTAKVVVAKDRRPSEFRFILERPALGSSNRLMRRFGSRRFIRARIQKDALNQKGNDLAEYFRRPFVIGGAVFRAFFAKEQNVFLVRTNEAAIGSGEDVRISTPDSSAATEMSFMQFIEWHNSLLLNSDQTMAKWAARFALPLSNSMPGLRLKHDNVKFVDDIICDSFEGKGKPPSEMQMTDGCGFANRAVMRMLHDKFPAWQDEPTAIQCRIGGAKGLLLVRHDLSPEEEIEPTIWLRPSQTKIRYSSLPLEQCILPSDTDPAKLTLDVLRASRMKCPARLSTETITNFAENGVPYECFSKLFQINLEDRVNALLKWEPADTNGSADTPQPDASAMKLLWHALAREGGVVAARLARVDSGRARISGYVADDQEDEFDDEDGLSQLDTALRQQSSAWWEDPISGSPSSLEETCMTLIDSGFRPDDCAVLGAKLREVAKKVVKTFQTKYRFAVPMSCSAFIVPDPYGVLKANEVHVRSSRRNLPDHQGRLTDLVLGDVLVTRHPCKVPSDVQKVKAVFHERLRHYCDVIVVSTESQTFRGEPLNRHLASLTGGGDYDGDTMEVFWDPDIVNAFHIPDPRVFAVEPPMVRACLQKNTAMVTEYLSQIPSTASEEFKIYSLQKYLLGALQDKSLVGQYSTWWENSTYANGYNHRDTIFLAYMFCAILDGSKTGVTVVPAKYKEHCRNQVWQARPPAWKESEEDREREELARTFRRQVQRPDTLPRFIMDRLRACVDLACTTQRRIIEKRLPPDFIPPRDDALARPWEEACSRAEELAARGCNLMREELDAIKAHVKAMYTRGKEMLHAAAREQKTGHFTELPIEKRQDALRKLSREFHSRPPKLLFFDAASARRVKSSYAYIYDYEHSRGKWSRFPWNVGTRALCEIKAEALGYPKTIAAEFYSWMAISPAYIRKYSQV